ncbi:MAG TPA: class I SAM-dependent methyltransferase [Mucilaginibacter sp.]|jgi:ubiquinone/menaquinone biosynthesis C-methylase UbiE|nr:class I SAM-dependent methyltransferase [Mucilaginibacter sp.]
MAASKLINPEIEDFYANTSEEGRLQLGLGPLEFERNKELISKYLPKKGVIIDVGGGPGIYSEWLAGMGHVVYLIDPVEKHIKQANKRSSKAKKPFKSLLGEAQKLELEDNIADVVILHGPLYHLQSKADRIRAITEAKRVLKPNGIALGFAINHSASTIAALLNGFIHAPEIFEMCKQELTSGIHTPPKNMPGVLPSAYFHRPNELKAEFEEAGLAYLETYAVEGVIWMDKNYFETRSDPKKKERIIELMKITEKDPALLSLSPHMMIAGKKV